MTKRFRLFAGPNGSGKTSLVDQIKKKFNIGYYINADELEAKLIQHKYLICSDFTSVDVSQNEWVNFINEISETDPRLKQFPNPIEIIKIIDGILTLKDDTPIHSYIAAIIAEFFRFSLLETDSSFSFETVMSHPSKVAFLETAREKEFRTYFYFISTKDPAINKNRVQLRVSKGGHDVDESKIESRYYRSLEFLAPAFIASDRAFIMDNSMDDQELYVLVEKDGDRITIYEDEIPEWIELYLLNKL